MDQGIIASFKSYYIRRTFATAIAALDADEGPKQNKLKAFWKGFNILNCFKSITAAWNQVKESNLKGVWKKLLPSLVDDFEGCDGIVKTIIVLEMAAELELEVQSEDLTELLESHNQLLSDADLLEMDKQNWLQHEQEAASEDITYPHDITTDELKVGIATIEDAIAYWENVDPNSLTIQTEKLRKSLIIFANFKFEYE
ncbi:DDE superfamily endonuclease [Popillia japonica]|uniref:DDE superfamily endonuclease n=1 Tax=Popillia japonica TaxID=7064 RepID=A0AAW1IX56_POPJA